MVDKDVLNAYFYWTDNDMEDDADVLNPSV